MQFCLGFQQPPGDVAGAFGDQQPAEPGQWSAFRGTLQAGENAAETLPKGMRVIVQGRLKSRSYETREGERRTVFEIEVDEVGPSLRYATAKVNRTSGGGGGGYSCGGGGGCGHGCLRGGFPKGA